MFCVTPDWLSPRDFSIIPSQLSKFAEIVTFFLSFLTINLGGYEIWSYFQRTPNTNTWAYVLIWRLLPFIFTSRWELQVLSSPILSLVIQMACWNGRKWAAKLPLRTKQSQLSYLNWLRKRKNQAGVLRMTNLFNWFWAYHCMGQVFVMPGLSKAGWRQCRSTPVFIGGPHKQ